MRSLRRGASASCTAVAISRAVLSRPTTLRGAGSTGWGAPRSARAEERASHWQTCLRRFHFEALVAPVRSAASIPPQVPTSTKAPCWMFPNLGHLTILLQSASWVPNFASHTASSVSVTTCAVTSDITEVFPLCYVESRIWGRSPPPFSGEAT